jgi:hypothetical protein
LIFFLEGGGGSREKGRAQIEGEPRERGNPNRGTLGTIGTFGTLGTGETQKKKATDGEPEEREIRERTPEKGKKTIVGGGCQLQLKKG